jgi:hypothetical protein
VVGRQRFLRRTTLLVAAVLVAAAPIACSGGATSDDAAGARTTSGGTPPGVEDTTAPDGDSGATGESDGGTIHETVPTTPRPTSEPVPIDSAAELGDGVTARVAAVEAVEAQPFLPGEVAGSAVDITIEISNGSSDAINLDNVTVDLTDADDRPATLITTRENRSLQDDLPPGDSRSGTYQFTIPVEDRAEVTLRVTYAAPKPTAVFEGNLADV